MQADDLMVGRIGNRGCVAVGEQDRTAVGGANDENAMTGCEHRRVSREKRDILRAHGLDIGETVVAATS